MSVYLAVSQTMMFYKSVSGEGEGIPVERERERPVAWGFTSRDAVQVCLSVPECLCIHVCYLRTKAHRLQMI